MSSCHPSFPSQPMTPTSSYFIFQNNNYFLETHLILLSDKISPPTLPSDAIPVHIDASVSHVMEFQIPIMTGHPRIMSSCHPADSTHHDDQLIFLYWKSILNKIARSEKDPADPPNQVEQQPHTPSPFMSCDFIFVRDAKFLIKYIFTLHIIKK